MSRKRRNRGFAVSAEVLEYRAAPSESLLSLLGGGMLMGLLPDSFGGPAPLLSETLSTGLSGDEIFQSTFIVQADEGETSPRPLRQESHLSISTAASSTVETARNAILSAVLDDLLSSALHEPVGSPDLSSAALPLPQSSDLDSFFRDLAPKGASFVPASLSNAGSPAPTGGGSAEFGGDVLGAAATAIPAPREHGQIEALQLAKVSESDPDEVSFGDEFMAMMSGGGSGGSGGESGGSTWGTPWPIHCGCNSQNEDPVAEDDSITIAEDTTATIDVLANDSDPENHPIFVTHVTQGSNGKVSFTVDAVEYLPNTNWYGSDSFEYTIKDGRGGSATATVNVTVTPVDDWPIGRDEIVVVGEGGSVNINLIANDSDAEGPVTIDWIDSFSGLGGEITNHEDGTATYNNWLEGESGGYSVGTGWDSFEYQIIDSTGKGASGRVDIYVVPSNPNYDDWPIIRPDYASTSEDTAVTFNIFGNDWDHEGPVTLVDVWAGQPGATIVDNGNGTVTYTPAPNFHGTDYFGYQIEDSYGHIATYSGQSGGNIEVTPVNDPPQVAVDEAWTGIGETITIFVLNGATDPETDAEEPGHELIVTDAYGAEKGDICFDGETVTYTPFDTFTEGTDTFTYEVKDGHGGYVTETVTVTMVNVTDWTVEYKDSDGNWNANPVGEAVWDHEELRWKASYTPTPPNGLTWVKWIAQDWNAFENDDDHEYIPPFAEYEHLDGGDEWAYGNPGVGIWAILPHINFAPPHQSDFVAQMNKGDVEDRGAQADATIKGIRWESSSSGAPDGSLETSATDVKFFPDGSTPLANIRNTVTVYVTIEPAISTRIYFKGFDVDDPSDHNGPIDADSPIDPALGHGTKSDLVADGMGGKKGDNIPTPGVMAADFHIDASDVTTPLYFAPGNVAAVAKTFTINWVQPGNNYRVAVSPRHAIDLIRLKPLAADEESRLFYDGYNGNDDIDHGTAQPEPLLDEDNGYRGIKVSSRLTVWRKLHVESDWMAAPPANEVFASDAENLDVDPNGPLPNVPMGLLVSGFEPAFIKVEFFDDHDHIDHEVPWDHNMDVNEMTDRTLDRRSQESNAYWVVAVVAAYEGDVLADHDGETGGLPGINSDNLGIDRSYIYLETIRDIITKENDHLAGEELQAAIGRFQQRIVLHEIGHEFVGTDHNFGLDVMSHGFLQDHEVDFFGNYDPKFEKFNEDNLKKIRSILRP